MLGPSVMFEQQRLRSQQKKRREQRQAESRHDDEEVKAQCRVRAYRFGDHIKRGPHGVLTLVPSAASNAAPMDMNMVKGMLMRSVYGDSIAFERVDWTTVQLFLLPDGEEIPSADVLCANDKVVVYVGASRFSGDIHDASNVEAHMLDPGFGPPRTGDGEADEEERGSEGRAAGGEEDDSDNSNKTRSSLDFLPDERESTQPDGVGGLTALLSSARGANALSSDSRRGRDVGGALLGHAVGQRGDPAMRGGVTRSDGARASSAGLPAAAAARRRAAPPPPQSSGAAPEQQQRWHLGGGGGGGGGVYTGLACSPDAGERLMELVHDVARAQDASSAGRLGRRSSAPDALEHGVLRALTAAHLLPERGGDGSAADEGGSGSSAVDGTDAAAAPRPRGRTATHDAHLSVVVGAPPHIRSSSVPLSSSLAPSADTPELLIASKAEALLQRLELLERRTREMDATTAGTRPAPASVAGAGGVPRRLSLVGNQKLRRAVHKLVLINRFNKAALLTPAAPIASKVSMRSSGSKASALRSSASKGGGRAAGSRWGFAASSSRKSIGKVMDQYIKEQSNLYEYNEVRKSNVKEDEKLPWYIIKPDVTWRVCWDMTMLVLVIYYSLLVPVRIGFDLDTSANEKSFDYFSDCFFIVDIAMSFMTTYKEDGLYVSDRLKIVRTYAKAWFPMDVLASMPVGWFTENLQTSTHGDSGTGGINKLLRMLRLFKLFRLLRLLKLFPKLLMVIETTVRIDPAILRFLRSFLMLLLMWHIMACAYWFMVRLEYNGTVDCPFEPDRPLRKCFINHCLCDVDITRDASRVTVLDETDTAWYDPYFPDIWVPHAAWADQPVVAQYCRAIMWAVVATTSIGENISPRSVQEHLFTAVMILFGLMMYSMIIGSASSALANLDTDAAERKQTLDRTIQYMRQRKVPMFFQKIIKDYYEHWWSIPQHNEDVMNDLPPALRTKLNLILNRDLIERFPILQHMQIDAYLKVVTRLTYATFLPGDFIVKQGDVGDHMFFIRSGKVDAILPNGVTVWLTLRPGDFFGEHSLLYLTRRDTSFRAVDFVDVLMLTRPDFTELYISAPEFVREIQRTDTERQHKRLELELKVLKKPGKKGGGGARDGSSSMYAPSQPSSASAQSTPSPGSAASASSPSSASGGRSSEAPASSPDPHSGAVRFEHGAGGRGLLGAAQGLARILSQRLVMTRHAVAPAHHHGSAAAAAAAACSSNSAGPQGDDVTDGSAGRGEPAQPRGGSPSSTGGPVCVVVDHGRGSKGALVRHATEQSMRAAGSAERAPSHALGGLARLLSLGNLRRGLGGGRGGVAQDGVNLAALELTPRARKRLAKRQAEEARHPYNWAATGDLSDDDDDDDGGMGGGALQQIRTVVPMQPHEVRTLDVPPEALLADRPRRRSLQGAKNVALEAERVRSLAHVASSGALPGDSHRTGGGDGAASGAGRAEAAPTSGGVPRSCFSGGDGASARSRSRLLPPHPDSDALLQPALPGSSATSGSDSLRLLPLTRVELPPSSSSSSPSVVVPAAAVASAAAAQLRSLSRASHGTVAAAAVTASSSPRARAQSADHRSRTRTPTATGSGAGFDAPPPPSAAASEPRACSPSSDALPPALPGYYIALQPPQQQQQQLVASRGGAAAAAAAPAGAARPSTVSTGATRRDSLGPHAPLGTTPLRSPPEAASGAAFAASAWRPGGGLVDPSRRALLARQRTFDRPQAARELAPSARALHVAAAAATGDDGGGGDSAVGASSLAAPPPPRQPPLADRAQQQLLRGLVSCDSESAEDAAGSIELLARCAGDPSAAEPPAP